MGREGFYVIIKDYDHDQVNRGQFINFEWSYGIFCTLLANDAIFYKIVMICFVWSSSGKIAKTIDFGWNQKLEIKKIYYFDCATATGYRLLIYRANKFVFIFQKFLRKWANATHPPYLEDYTNTLSTCLYILKCLVT